MRTLSLSVLLLLIIFSCKNETQPTIPEDNLETEVIIEQDSVIEEVQEPIKKTTKQIKSELTKKGFKTFDYVDEETKDTVLMQQYFMVFLKTGEHR